MTRSEKFLCVVYALIAVIALYATWSNNFAFLAQSDDNSLLAFLRAGYANPAAASLANDLLLFAVAAFIFMMLEARRLRMRFAAAYIVLSLLIAVSVFFPLFLIARQRKLAALRMQEAAPVPNNSMRVS